MLSYARTGVWHYPCTGTLHHLLPASTQALDEDQRYPLYHCIHTDNFGGLLLCQRYPNDGETLRCTAPCIVHTHILEVLRTLACMHSLVHLFASVVPRIRMLQR
jgi:hypothetical protein